MKFIILSIILSVTTSVTGYTEFFDSVYYTYPRNNVNISYGYDISRVCNLIDLNGVRYAALYDAYTIFKTSYVKLLNIDPKSSIENCFNYKAFSYIISRNENITFVMRGYISKSFRLKNYDQLIYDHISSKLYAREGGILSEINMTMLENFWLIENYPQKLLEDRKNVSLNDLFIKRNSLIGQIEDLMVFNNTIYFIRPEPKGRVIYKTNIGEIQEEYLMEYDKPYFDFIPFLHISKYYETNSKIKLSLGPVSPSIVISLPSSSIKSIESLPMPMIILLYFLDAVFVIITVYAFKHLFKLSRERYNRLKSVQEEEVAVSEYEPVYQDSLPYHNIVVQNS